MASGYIREIQPCTQRELHRIAAKNGSIRGGATISPDARANSYEHGGYSGKMYVAKTENMMTAEDKILKHGLRHNQHDRSNAQAVPGFIYIIKGKKIEKKRKNEKKRGQKK